MIFEILLWYYEEHISNQRLLQLMIYDWILEYIS